MKQHLKTGRRASGPPRTPGIGRILVAPLAGMTTRGKLVIAGGVIPCALGRSGITHRKREGDGATPAGQFRLVGFWTRADRLSPIRSAIPRRIIGPSDGWCDDPASPAYNRPVRLPSSASHEVMWREDALYDIVLMLDYNLRHPRKGRGSAIFFHVAAADGGPTAGCVAIQRDAMRRLLPRLRLRTTMIVKG